MTSHRQRHSRLVTIFPHMKLKNDSVGILGILSALALAPVFGAHAQTNSPAAPDDSSNRYGLFNALDHRSSYGQGAFPEPFLVDDSDLEDDEVTAEIEKGFGLMTVEAELHYERASEAGDVVDGIGNIDLGARYPFYQFVSENGFFDTTAGAGVEVGIPVHSS